MTIENLKQLADQHHDAAFAFMEAGSYNDTIESWSQRAETCQEIIDAGDASYIAQLGSSHANLGTSYIFLENVAKALAHLQKVVALWNLKAAPTPYARPKNILHLWVNLSSAHAMQKRPDLALEQLNIAEQYLASTQQGTTPFPDNEFLDQHHLLVKQMAWLHYRAGHWREGARRYREAAEIAEKKWRALDDGKASLIRGIQLTVAWHRGNLARCLQGLGEYAHAAQEFEAAQSEFARILGTEITAEEADDWENLAHLYLDASNVHEKLDVQLESSRTALRIYQQLVAIGHDSAIRFIPRARHNIGGELMRLGQLSAARAELEMALSELADHRLFDNPGTVTERANFLTTLATIRFKLGEPNSDLSGCLPPAEASETTWFVLVSGNNSALRLWEQGYRELAIAELQATLDASRPPTPENSSEFWAAWALGKRNLGGWLSQVDGGAESSRKHLADAEAIYKKLSEHGSSRFLQELVKTKNAIAGNLLHTGLLSDALMAWRALWHEVHSSYPGEPSEKVHLLGSIARNLGLAATRQGRKRHATRYQILGLHYFLELEKTAPEEFAPEVTEIRLTIGDLLKDQGKYAQAVAHFEAALAGFDTLRQQGRSGYLLEEAIGKETLALGYLARKADGDIPRARLLLKSALKIHSGIDPTRFPEAALASVFTATVLARLAEERWFDFLQAFDSEPIPLMLECRDDLKDAFAAISKVGPLQDHRNLLRAFDAVVGLLVHLVYRWPGFMGMQMGIAPEAVDAVSLWLLRQVGHVLTHRSPKKLADEYDDRFKRILTTIFIALRYIGTPQSLAQYFLFTQGLRAQRQAFDLWQHSGDEELQALSVLYAKLEKLDVEILGLAADGGTHPSQKSSRDLLSGAGHFHQQHSLNEQRAHLWTTQIAPRIQTLERSGKLPAHAFLTLEEINQRLVAADQIGSGQQTPSREISPIRRRILDRSPRRKLKRAWKIARQPSRRHALLLMLACPEDQGKTLVVLAVQGDVTKARPAVAELEVSLPFTETALRQWVKSLALATGSDARRIRGFAFDGELEVLPMHAQDALTSWQTAPQVLAGTLSRLSSQGITDVHIVPSGDFHLAPWAAELHGFEGLSVKQYPTVASWWRVCGERLTEAVKPCRWASLAWDAKALASTELLWVEPEARALATIWDRRGERGESLSSTTSIGSSKAVVVLDPQQPCWPLGDSDERPVDGLIGIGHGAAPHDNWAKAGLVIGHRKAAPSPSEALRGPSNPWEYFSASDLHRVLHVKRLVMSCCALGRIGDAQGEPIGMTALAFSFDTSLAVGAMVQIPDFEGALFSMALHFAWARGEADCLAKGQPMDWSGVFHATRRSVMAGQWPPGFGAWLGQALPGLATGPCARDFARRVPGVMTSDAYTQLLATAPTPALREVASLFTCLG